MINLKKVFLYLYPIEEYTAMFLHGDEDNSQNPLSVLNECIQKRYRDNDYQVVYALYPDKDIFGIIPKENDRIIYTDILFSEISETDEYGREKKDFVPKYPSEQLLIEQLGDIQELVIGGYHFSDCVKIVGETALNMGVNTIIDLDLTDIFFNLYNQADYFDMLEYNPEKFKRQMMMDDLRFGEKIALEQFNYVYSSPVYGFSQPTNKNIHNKEY